MRWLLEAVANAPYCLPRPLGRLIPCWLGADVAVSHLRYQPLRSNNTAVVTVGENDPNPVLPATPAGQLATKPQY